MPELPLLHVGYHKTATTWMQRRLFQPVHGYRQMATHREISDLVVRPLGRDFDPAAMRAHVAAGMAGLEPGEVPVLSSEILSGHPFLGGRESDAFAARLKAIFPQARILISIRAQMRILPSVYMQYVLRGGTMPYDLFFAGTTEPGYFGFVPEHFEYDRLVGLYGELFGAENVHVLTQESLRADIDAAAAQLAAFAGATRFARLSDKDRDATGVSYPEYAVPVLRRINHVQTSTMNPRPIVSIGKTPGGLYGAAGWLMRRPFVARLLGDPRPVTAHVRRTFAGRYDASNARLRALVGSGIDLGGY